MFQALQTSLHLFTCIYSSLSVSPQVLHCIIFLFFWYVTNGILFLPIRTFSMIGFLLFIIELLCPILISNIFQFLINQEEILAIPGRDKKLSEFSYLSLYLNPEIRYKRPDHINLIQHPFRNLLYPQLLRFVGDVNILYNHVPILFM